MQQEVKSKNVEDSLGPWKKYHVFNTYLVSNIYEYHPWKFSLQTIFVWLHAA